MIHVLASVAVKSDRMDPFLTIFKENVPLVLAEQGCLEYAPACDIDASLDVQQLNPQMVTVIEKWESLEDLHAHLKAPHMETYREKVKDLIESVTLKVLQEA